MANLGRKISVVIVIILVLLSFSIYADGAMVRVRGSGQVAGNLYASASGNNASVDTGFAIAAEALYKLLPYLQIGGGLEYQISRGATFSGSSIGSFQFIPFYGMVRVPFQLGAVEPYIAGRVGYGIFSGDSTFTGSGLVTLSGGLYFTVGGGVDYNLGGVAIFAEASYAINDGSASALGTTSNMTYSRLDICLGVAVPL